MSFLHAFPSSLRDIARKPCAVIEAHFTRSQDSPKYRDILIVDDEDVWLPGRIHSPGNYYIEFYDRRPFEAAMALLDDKSLNDTQRTMFLALLTRHHNGFVREMVLKAIIGVNEAWIVPFVLKLASEYVFEVILHIQTHLNELDPKLYGAFTKTNPAYFYKFKQQVTSYWNCYYRHYDYNSFNGEVTYVAGSPYPGHEIIRYLEGFVESV